MISSRQPSWMEDIFEAATRLLPAPVAEWKAAGKPVVGYTCSYLPVEILRAAGILPVRLRGIGTEGTRIADSYYGPFVCSFPKCILQRAGTGDYRFLDGAVISPGCDSMRRLDECWRKAGQDHPGIVPAFFHYLHVPHKTDAHSLAWFEAELRCLMAAVSAYFAVPVTDAALCAAIDQTNAERRLLRDLAARREADVPPVSGTEAFAATLAARILPAEVFARVLGRRLAELDTVRPAGPRPRRLMLAGSISDSLELFQLVESGPGAVIVAENLCFGVSDGDVATSGDPVEALARHYLGEMTCPRHFGAYPARLARLRAAIGRAGVDGVILQNIRFCDLHGADNALLARDLEAEGVPCLRLEREYGPQSDTGRMRLRIDAFIERLAARAGARSPGASS